MIPTGDHYDYKSKLFHKKEMLEDYIEVEDISKVPLNTHLRYFSEKKNEKTKKIEKVFRMGGFLVNKNNYDKYVILATAPNTGVINSNAKINLSL